MGLSRWSMMQRWPHPPSQEASASSKYDIKDSFFRHTSNHAKKLNFGIKVSRWWYMMLRMNPSSKTPNRNHQHPSSMTLRMGGYWFTSNHAGGRKFGKQVKNHISKLFMMSRITRSSKTPVRTHQCHPSMTLRTWAPQLNSNHAR